MDKEGILQASREENKNKDLAELEILRQAGIHASRVGALVCSLVSLLSSTIAHIVLYSPWVIYFSIIATQWLVRYTKLKRRSDLAISILFLLLAVLSLFGFVTRLFEANR